MRRSNASVDDQQKAIHDEIDRALARCRSRPAAPVADALRTFSKTDRAPKLADLMPAPSSRMRR